MMGEKDKNKEEDSLAPEDPSESVELRIDKPTSEPRPTSKIARKFLSRTWTNPVKPKRNIELEEMSRVREGEQHLDRIKKPATKAAPQRTKPSLLKLPAYLREVQTKLGMTEPEFETALRSWLDRGAVNSVPLPGLPPELWSARFREYNENPVEFVRRVYGRWIGRGLTRAHIRQLDLPLYRALSAWMSRHPDDVMTDLPSLSEAIDQKVARLSAEFTPDELRKLGLALQNRARRL